MPTVSYTFVSRCTGGEHLTLDVSLNGGAANRWEYDVDTELRPPLNTLTEDERKTLARLILKVHMAGKTRAQMTTEFQSGPITITI